MLHYFIITIIITFHRYRDALVSVMSELLRKMQFGFNQTQLEELDDELLDDDVSLISVCFLIFSSSWLYFKNHWLDLIELALTYSAGLYLNPSYRSGISLSTDYILTSGYF